MIQYNTVSGSYEIEATYCKPDSGSSKVLQILTHGIGFDRRYVHAFQRRVLGSDVSQLLESAIQQLQLLLHFCRS